MCVCVCGRGDRGTERTGTGTGMRASGAMHTCQRRRMACRGVLRALIHAAAAAAAAGWCVSVSVPEF